MIESAAAKRDTVGEPTVHLVDLDRRALQAARARASSQSLQRLRTFRANVLRTGGIRFNGREPGGYSVVDAVGLLEYLQPDDWTYRYHKVVRAGRAMAGAITFLRNAYEFVRPGGMLIFGNMLDSHPELAFTLNVVQWPHIQPRSIDAIRDIVVRTGIAGETEVHLPDDGVYAIYAVKRPRA